jgi:3-isopropylmalate/(R)-2-methylmalate dehydratase small subunit
MENPVMSELVITGKVFVVGDNIDTDQIIPAQYLNLVPTIPEEYRKLGSYALCGLPDQHCIRYVREGEFATDFPIIVAGRNFGCGSSREHAPISLGAAGCKAVVANSFARIFFRNCVATGEVYPIETGESLNEVLKTGDSVEVRLGALRRLSDGREFPLNPLGDVREVVEAGGIFNYARKAGMIAAR